MEKEFFNEATELAKDNLFNIAIYEQYCAVCFLFDGKIYDRQIKIILQFSEKWEAMFTIFSMPNSDEISAQVQFVRNKKG